jgi:hypothetical protein
VVDERLFGGGRPWAACRKKDKKKSQALIRGTFVQHPVASVND